MKGRDPYFQNSIESSKSHVSALTFFKLYKVKVRLLNVFKANTLRSKANTLDHGRFYKNNSVNNVYFILSQRNTEIPSSKNNNIFYFFRWRAYYLFLFSYFYELILTVPITQSANQLSRISTYFCRTT